jgi:CheY-like chemotaxis protein
MKILVVEDELASLKLAHLVLSEDGHEVTQAEAAGKAVEEILRSEPEAILLDLELPGIDGLTLARNLKRNPKTQHIAIIVITACPERYPRKQAMEIGCDGYIVKPINTRKLSQQVENAVEKGRI